MFQFNLIFLEQCLQNGNSISLFAVIFFLLISVKAVTDGVST